MNIEQETGPDLRAALVPILSRNGGRWLRYLVAILKNEADAEDTIQDAIKRVLARNCRHESENHIAFYLGRAISNAAFELYNCRKKEQIRLVPIVDHVVLPSPGPDPYECMEEVERTSETQRMLKLLNEGLKRLPVKEYEAVRLTIMESGGLSIRDIGATCGIPYSTLRHRTRKGLKQLRSYIARHRSRTASRVTER
ncbi:MAG: sigma-70 family RNA polymerase sigma factor [Acidobacteria bacterium]|nr:sigma-70 family RNA polymerase sigma factor [Acidobacteriota bacterium]